MTVPTNRGLLKALRKLDCVERPDPNRWVASCPFHDDHESSLRIEVRLSYGKATLDIRCTTCSAGFEEFRVFLAKYGIKPGSLQDGLTFLGEESEYFNRPKDYRVPLQDFHRANVSDAHSLLMADKALQESLLRRYGLNENTLVEFCVGFRRGYTFPIYEHGVLVNILRRVPAELDTGEVEKWRGLRGVTQSIWPDPVGIRENVWVLWTEGLFCTLLARQHGLPAFTGTAGADAGLAARWRKYFRGRIVVVCFECGVEGRARAAKVEQRFLRWGCEGNVVYLGLEDGEDLTDWFVKYGHSTAELMSLIEKSRKFGGTES